MREIREGKATWGKPARRPRAPKPALFESSKRGTNGGEMMKTETRPEEQPACEQGGQEGKPKLVVAYERLSDADLALKDAKLLLGCLRETKNEEMRWGQKLLGDAISLERGVAGALQRYLGGRPLQYTSYYDVSVKFRDE